MGFGRFFLGVGVGWVVWFEVGLKGGEGGNRRFLGKRMSKKGKNRRFEVLF